MVTVKLYVEGAAQKNDLKRTRCREAFSAFFQTAGVASRPRTVPCGGRKEAYDAFVTAVRTAKPGDLPLLLDATKVEAACPHAKALLNRLRSL